jgi:DNA polymerase III alpha subunit
MMAIVQLEDTTGKIDAVAFPKSYKKVFDKLVEENILLVEGTLDERGGQKQVLINDAEGLTIEELVERAKKEKLWNPDEKIVRSSSRHQEEEEEVDEVMQVMEIKEEEIKELDSSSLFSNPNARQILLSHGANKDLLVTLRDLLIKYPGNDDVELVIGQEVLPLSFKVTWSDELMGHVNQLLAKI